MKNPFAQITGRRDSWCHLTFRSRPCRRAADSLNGNGVYRPAISCQELERCSDGRSLLPCTNRQLSVWRQRCVVASVNVVKM